MTDRARRLSRWLAVAALGIVVVAAGAAAWLWSATTLEPPEPSVHVVDRHGRFLAALPAGDGELGYWRLSSLPPRVVRTVLTVEDQRFAWHPGVDVAAVARAAWQNVTSGERVSGASTLAMQCARMQRPGPRTWSRKIAEAVTALVLTARHRRHAILRHYLTVAPYGHRIHGIAYAARYYFAKPLEDLSWAEVAVLCALPQAPSRMDPYQAVGRRRALARAGRILDALLEADELTALDHRVARRQLPALKLAERPTRPTAAMHAILELERVIEREGLGGSPLVTSTLDLRLQREVTWMAREALWQWHDRGAGNVAVIVVTPASGEVLAWVGSSDYFDDRRSGAIDYARVPRSPGSTLKPFLYAAALDSGRLSPAQTLDDLGRGAGGIGNSDERFLGPMLPRFALANSRNVPAANLLAELGLDATFDLWRRLGLHDGAHTAHRYGLGLAVGGMPTTLARLIRASTALATDGGVRALRWHLGSRPETGARLFSEPTARLITVFLSDPMARLPTFPRMGATEYRFPVALKTGTSSQYHDAWTVAWSRSYLVGVWVGHPDHRPMQRLTGAGSAAVLARKVLRFLHPQARHGLDDLSFPPPSGASPVRLCPLTGQRAGPACPKVVTEWLQAGQEPTDTCTAHVVRAVDRRTGRLATKATPRAEVEVRTFVDLPPRYARWQASTGLPPPPCEPRAAESRRASAQNDAGPRASGEVRVVSPRDGSALKRDPETPADLATLALEAVSDPPTEQIVWYVNGIPYRITEPPHSARWPLVRGTHTFQARVPSAGFRSRVVTVTIQ
jgi:penicillin-binding protein 1C